ncbi:MAG: efflux RND transporter permease subunit [Planctomycetes bacterium]|nr:efflux RND transporter permease subunit [Planctomycetota bacterium]
MPLIRLAFWNPYAVAVLVLATLVLGGTTLARISVDLLPIFKTPAVQIVTFYPGMAATTVEQDITTRLERWTGQSVGIAGQESKSMLGVSIVKDFFHEDIDPNLAMSQVTSYAMSDLYYLPPGTVPPMVMPFDPTASTPLCLLAVSHPTMSETEVYDVAYFNLRNRLQSIPGVIAPAVYGGKLRRILGYVDRDALWARRLAPMDVVRSLHESNVFIPTGSARFGALEYQIDTNAMAHEVRDMGTFPVLADGARQVRLKDVADARDSAEIQTNVVRVDGRRQVYIPIYRQPGANTIAVVEGVRGSIEQIKHRLPEGMNLDLVFDQSVFVRQAIAALGMEALFGAALAAAMVLLFLRSWRATGLVVASLPLALLVAIVGLYFTGQTINTMTLGGLAIAVGLLIDQSIVVLENVERRLAGGEPVGLAAREGALEVATPLLVITLTILVVFVPIVFLSGVARFLFTPLALAVAFALVGSFVFAVTAVPLLCARALRARTDRAAAAGGATRRLQAAYLRALEGVLRRPRALLLALLVNGGCCLALSTQVGEELFPRVDSGQLMVRVRAPSGTRLERTEALCAEVEAAVAAALSPGALEKVITNIGVLNDWPAAYTPNSGPQDAFILLQLRDDAEERAPDVARRLRTLLPVRFPGVEFAFDTAGILTAAINLGLPAPLNVQVEGKDLEVSRRIAEEVRARVARLPGAVDVRIQNRLDAPKLEVIIDRERAASIGLTTEDVVQNIVTALNSSVSFAKSFWIDERNGNHYFLGAQYPEEAIESLDTLRGIPLSSPLLPAPVPVSSVATFRRTTVPSEVTHRNITRVLDVYADVAGADLGSVAAAIERELEQVRASGLVPASHAVNLRGEAGRMRETFRALALGLLLAAVLVYLVMVVQFRSFLDPLVVMLAVPLGAFGVVLALWLSGTPLSVPALLGSLMMIGIVVSFSVLLVEFANRRVAAGAAPREAMLEAARDRLRPILMTSLTTALGLLPMAIVGGANGPLARAVFGGVVASALLTLFVVPVLYTLVRRSPARGATPAPE